MVDLFTKCLASAGSWQRPAHDGSQQDHDIVWLYREIGARIGNRFSISGNGNDVAPVLFRMSSSRRVFPAAGDWVGSEYCPRWPREQGSDPSDIFLIQGETAKHLVAPKRTNWIWFAIMFLGT